MATEQRPLSPAAVPARVHVEDVAAGEGTGPLLAPDPVALHSRQHGLHHPQILAAALPFSIQSRPFFTYFR